MEDLELFTQEIEDLAGLIIDNNGLERREFAADNIRLVLKEKLLKLDRSTTIKTLSREAGRSGLVNTVELATV
jgi:hypothetical protein